ncbi:GNAT family N-acetyltransferase [Candidatus Woesearchaeota archaeon]|nr:GNAT family N-acetyltransferase [Candidatus Woesearchaeota archaeon]
MLELKLFRELSSQQKHEAAVVMAGDELELRSLPPEQRPEEAVSGYLRRLRSSAREKVVVAATIDESVVAFYVLPPFSMRGSGMLTPRNAGFIMVEPAKQRQGIGTHVIRALQQIFESFAYSAHADSLKHSVGVHDGAVVPFERCGYTSESPPYSPFKNDLRIFTRQYYPQQHSLGKNEASIVAEFSKKLQV